jgi:hypothetical protein
MSGDRPAPSGGRTAATPRHDPQGTSAARPRGRSRGPFEQTALYVAACAAVLSLLMIAANTGILLIDRVVQQQVNERQQGINEGAQINRVDQVLVRALAMQAASAHDDALRDLLNRNGVTFQLTPTAAKAAPAAPAALSTAVVPAMAPAAGAAAPRKD